MLNLLKLDKEIQSFILSLDSTDERLKVLTERRLRPLVQITDREIPRKRFWEMMELCSPPFSREPFDKSTWESRP